MELHHGRAILQKLACAECGRNGVRGIGSRQYLGDLRHCTTEAEAEATGAEAKAPRAKAKKPYRSDLASDTLTANSCDTCGLLHDSVAEQQTT